MKTTISALFTLALTLALIAPQTALAHGDEPHGEIGRTELNALYTAYLDVHHALARDDFEKAQKVTRDFVRAPHKFPTELSHNVKTADLLADLRTLNAAKDIKAYRHAFESFSKRMITLMTEAENAGDMPAYVYSCPMVRGRNTAEWLQAKEGLENPYHGSGMFRCGKLERVLIEPGAGASGGESHDHDAHHGHSH